MAYYEYKKSRDILINAGLLDKYGEPLDKIRFPEGLESDCDGSHWTIAAEYMLSLEAERDALRAEIEQLKNPWISVEDELPEEHEIIDGLQYEDERMVDIEFYDGSFFGPEQDFSVDDDGYGCFANTDKLKGITHWMRRPKLEGKGDE